MGLSSMGRCTEVAGLRKISPPKVQLSLNLSGNLQMCSEKRKEYSFKEGSLLTGHSCGITCLLWFFYEASEIERKTSSNEMWCLLK